MIYYVSLWRRTSLLLSPSGDNLHSNSVKIYLRNNLYQNKQNLYLVLHIPSTLDLEKSSIIPYRIEEVWTQRILVLTWPWTILYGCMYVQPYLNKDVSLEKIVSLLNQVLIYSRYQTQVSCRMTDQYASSTLSMYVTSTINEHTSSMITNW